MTKHLGKWLIGAAVALFSWVGLSRLDFDVDVLSLFPADLPEAKGMRLFFEHFSRDNEVLVSLEGEEPEAVSAAAARLAKALEAEPGLVDRVVWRALLEETPDGGAAEPESGSGPDAAANEALRSGAELIAWSWWNGDTEALRALAGRLNGGALPKGLAEAVDELGSGFISEDVVRLGYDPLRLTVSPGGLSLEESGAVGDAFVSPEGTFRVLYIDLAGGEAEDYRETDDRLSRLRELVKETVGGEIAVGYTGEPVFVAEISTGMERDIRGSSGGAIGFICLLFWFLHRTIRPLFWLVAMILLTYAITLAAGALFFGKLSVLTVGFAAILIGLIDDYPVLIYGEAGHDVRLREPRALRAAVAPGILWAALTTSMVFFSLNVFSLPSVRDLGNLVGLGILIAAAVMLLVYLPFVVRFFTRYPEKGNAAEAGSRPPARDRVGLWRGITMVVLTASVAVLVFQGLPEMVKDFRPLSQRRSQATQAFERIQDQLFPGGQRSVPLVVTGSTPESLASAAAAARSELEKAKEAGEIGSFSLEPGLVPVASRQEANAPLIASLVAERDAIRQAILDAGFTDEAAGLFEAVCEAWQRLAAREERPLLPESTLGRWLMGRAYSDEAGAQALLGSALPPDAEGAATGQDWTGALRQRQNPDFRITGWAILTSALMERTRGDLVRGAIPAGVLLLAMLFATYRGRVRDTLLSVGCLVFSGLVLMAVTRLFGWSWNYFNLAAVPILMGTGVGYSIHMILALRRHGGDLREVRASIGKALWFCGPTTAVGFGSLAGSSSNGLSSLGMVCGVGIVINLLVAMCLLPRWWVRLGGAPPDAASKTHPDSSS